MTEFDQNPTYRDIVGWHGGNWGLFLQNIDLIKDTIGNRPADAVDETVAAVATRAAEAMEVKQAKFRKPPIIHGGIRVAHVHYEGGIYLLDKEQWEAFSSKILNQLAEKLTNANTVSYSQLMKLSDAVDEIV